MVTLTAFIPETFSFPGEAWERKGRAALSLEGRPQVGRACQTELGRALPDHEGTEASC